LFIETAPCDKSMQSENDASSFVRSLYQTLLDRSPKSSELDRWTEFLMNEQRSPEQLYYRVLKSKEYQQRLKAPCRFPPGHYYSPIVNPDGQVKAYLTKTDSLAGIDVSLKRMEMFWTRCVPGVRSMQIREGARYHVDPRFSYGDATALRAMLWDLKP